MSKVEVIETVAAPAAAVWNILSDFGGIKVGGPIEAFEVEGEGVGAVRTITMGGGKVIEKLTRHDDAAMTFSYSIENDDCPLPVSGYVSTVVITALDDTSCEVNWSSVFEPRGVDEATAVKIITGVYTGGIEGARRALVS